MTDTPIDLDAIERIAEKASQDFLQDQTRWGSIHMVIAIQHIPKLTDEIRRLRAEVSTFSKRPTAEQAHDAIQELCESAASAVTPCSDTEQRRRNDRLLADKARLFDMIRVHRDFREPEPKKADPDITFDKIDLLETAYRHRANGWGSPMLNEIQTTALLEVAEAAQQVWNDGDTQNAALFAALSRLAALARIPAVKP